ncbi:MAG: bis(5'-nucleosyl)-tetraphosphatase, symmetrical [Nitrospirales bacterium]|nr:MAG: bis(5'-nucleosyl)-tetraphosphatase, symmetrical [Nitrospirales bacterium]
MATYVIGDIQGCFKALRKLMRRIKFDAACDRLWLVGDLVNRGPDSLAVLRYIKELGPAAVTVLGNHDLHLLAIWAGVTKLQHKDTLGEVLSAPDCDELLTWLRFRSMIHLENGYLMLHAGLLPQWTATQAVTLAREVETALRSKNFVELLPFIYFRHAHGVWSKNLSYHDRLSFSTNVLTRLRMCSADGVPDFSFKGAPDQADKGLVPWFQAPRRSSNHEVVIFGHWSALGLYVHDTLIGLDTGCVWGRALTALRLEDRKLFRVSCAK